MNLATLLICHSRQDHLVKVLDALNDSDRPFNSPLIIYSQDSPRQVINLLTNYNIANKTIVTSEGYNFKSTKQAINHNVFNGLKYVFDNFDVDACLVLEDDIVISPDAYSYFIGILDKFKLNSRFRGVNGFSVEVNPYVSDRDYVRVNYGLGWGWAIPRKTFNFLAKYWTGLEDEHWDFILEPYIRTGFVVVPIRSRILNIGFDSTATHTKNDSRLGERIFDSYQTKVSQKQKEFAESSAKYNWRIDCFRISQAPRIRKLLIYFIGWLCYLLQRIEIKRPKISSTYRISIKRYFTRFQ
jgi:hypothetical protein